jgi:fucose 4-O-acetylase-like acetyltransferase
MSGGFIDEFGLFRVPLFFFVSGVFFKAGPSFGVDTAKKADALIKPYLTTLLALALAGWIIRGDDLVVSLVGIAYGSADTIEWLPLWFLTHLFAVFVVARLIWHTFRLDSQPESRQWLVILAMFVVGVMSIRMFYDPSRPFMSEGIEAFFSSWPPRGLPFSLDILPVTLAYFLAGTMLKDKVVNLKERPWRLLLALAVILSIIVFSDAAIQVNSRLYSVPFFALPASIAVIYIILSLSKTLARFPRVQRGLSLCGQSSLFILIFHSTVERFAAMFLVRFQTILPDFLVPETVLRSSVWHVAMVFLAFGAAISVPIAMRAIVKRIPLFAALYLPSRALSAKPVAAKDSV